MNIFTKTKNKTNYKKPNRKKPAKLNRLSRLNTIQKVVALIFIVGIASIGVKLTFDSHAAVLPVIQPTAGAVSVRSYCVHCDGTGDDTAAFRQAIEAASKPGTVQYKSGPTGQPQGVVYVPAGKYKLLELMFNSNIRMEVDAGAVLEQAGGRNVDTKSVMIRWDGEPNTPLTNVSLVGVGSSSGGIKAAANPVASGWSIDNSFTINMDPTTSGGANFTGAITVLNTKGFLIANVFSIENDHIPAPATKKSARPCDGYFSWSN